MEQQYNRLRWSFLLNLFFFLTNSYNLTPLYISKLVSDALGLPSGLMVPVSEVLAAQSVALSPVASVSRGGLLEMQTFRCDHRSTESESAF